MQLGTRMTGKLQEIISVYCSKHMDFARFLSCVGKTIRQQIHSKLPSHCFLAHGYSSYKFKQQFIKHFS